MSDHTPSQAEGDRDDQQDTPDRTAAPPPTPSQAEGDRDDTTAEEDDTDSQGSEVPTGPTRPRPACTGHRAT